MNVDSGGWGAVCDDGFNSAAAAAFCHDLGFSSWASAAQYDTTHGSGSFALDDVRCPSGSSHVSDCAVASHGAYSDNCGDSETVGIDCATANTPAGYFSVSGDCFTSDGARSDSCVHSTTHLSGGSYSNGEDCTITVHNGGTLHNTGSFSTESCCDHISLGGSTYSGSSGPSDRTMNAGDQITWHTDGSVTHTGWEFCLI